MKPLNVAVLVSIGLSSCASVGLGDDQPVTVDGITLLTHQGGSNDAYPAGLGIGRLAIRDGCIAMERSAGPATFILWPPGYGLRTRGGMIEVTDAEGDLVAARGDPITLGGGFGELPWAVELTGGSIPNECRDDAVERYFIAAPDAWPFAETDGVTLLRHGGNRLSGDTALLEGTLAVVDGCVAIEDGPWLLWPIDYGVSQDQAPPLEIEDGDQRVVARVGDHVRLGGGIGDSMPDPAGFPGGIPGDCQQEGEHYWYVGAIEIVS
ncbi:MAG: hypothetical protein WEE66_05565 [Actinomycetota bacterium]